MFHPIVEEELALLARVTALLAENPEPPAPSEAGLVRELERLRELLISGSDQKDRASLQHQWDRQNALLRQLRTSRAQPRVDPNSPYFAHLRLREGDVERDLCLGRAERCLVQELEGLGRGYWRWWRRWLSAPSASGAAAATGDAEH